MCITCIFVVLVITLTVFILNGCVPCNVTKTNTDKDQPSVHPNRAWQDPRGKTKKSNPQNSIQPEGCAFELGHEEPDEFKNTVITTSPKIEVLRSASAPLPQPQPPTNQQKPSNNSVEEQTPKDKEEELDKEAVPVEELSKKQIDQNFRNRPGMADLMNSIKNQKKDDISAKAGPLPQGA